MAETSLNRSIETIERALDRIEAREKNGGFSQPSAQDDAAHRAEIDALQRRHDAKLEESNQTIASLRSELAALERSKEQELASLRAEMAEQRRLAENPPSAASDLQYQALLKKYQNLKRTSEDVVGALDSLITESGGTKNG